MIHSDRCAIHTRSVPGHPKLPLVCITSLTFRNNTFHIHCSSTGAFIHCVVFGFCDMNISFLI